MTLRTSTSLVAPRPVGLMASMAWLLALNGLAFVPTASVAGALHGAAGVGAATAALVVCFAGGVAALAAGHLISGPMNALAGVLLGMFARMAAPLVCCVVLMIERGPLVDAGFIIYLLVFYLVTLGVETWLAVGRVAPTAAKES